MNEKMTAILIDDESLAIETLTSLLEIYCPEVEIVGSGNSVEQGLMLVEEHTPHIIFLDIEMPNGNGFLLLNKVDTTHIKIIFTTAYAEYTIQAIRKGVHDYLMKPIDSDELVSSIDRLKKSILNQEPHEEKVLIQCMDKVHRITLNQIKRCESESNYTHLFLNSEKKITVSMTLKSVEQKLIHDNSFIRVHQSHLVNANYIASLNRGTKPSLVLESGEKIPISYRKKTQVYARINC